MSSLDHRLTQLLTHGDLNDWQPRRFDAGDRASRQQLDALIESRVVRQCRDTLLAQLYELLETRNPSRDLTEADLRALAAAHLKDTVLAHHGTWVFYPWSGCLARVLPEAEFKELRTSRNRNKITAEEQALLRTKRVGVVGLSVGQAVAYTLAMEEVAGELVLADFDTLGLSNMNRLRARVQDLGVKKAVLTAREIFELNPYAHIELYPDGLTEQTLERFLTLPRKLDLVIDECDDFFVKVTLREQARAHRAYP